MTNINLPYNPEELSGSVNGDEFNMINLNPVTPLKEFIPRGELDKAFEWYGKEWISLVKQKYQGEKYLDDVFCGSTALYGDKPGNDWKNCVWRGLDDMWDESGKPVSGKLVLEDGFGSEDISQGKVGDCWFLSGLSVVAQNWPEMLKKLIHPLTSTLNKHNAYIVWFYKARN